MGVSWADNYVKIRWNLPISNPKPDRYNINAYTKFGENPLKFTQVFIRKRKKDGWMDGCTTDGRTDRHTDVQRETIIPRHYRVAGYKNGCHDCTQGKLEQVYGAPSHIPALWYTTLLCLYKMDYGPLRRKPWPRPQASYQNFKCAPLFLIHRAITCDSFKVLAQKT